MKQHLQECFCPQQSLPVTPHLQSEHYQQYLQYFGEVSNATQNKQQLIDLLHESAIRNHEQELSQYVKVMIVGGSSNYEVIELQVRIFCFSVPIQVLNIKGISNLHELQNISSTASYIYTHDEILPQTAVKCIRYNDDYFTTIFTKILRQYSILKIASTLKIAPPIKVLGGFDLYIYEDCIEFTMQKCYSSSSIYHQYFQELKLRLYLLHQLNIVHLDIKPENVTYSPSLDTLVFIDFGLSDILQEKIGLKTLVGFSGSINFCSPEMFQCYHSQSPQFVDLYYNDIFGLKATFKQIFQKEGSLGAFQMQIRPKDIIKTAHLSFTRNVKNFYLQSKIKSAIYNRDSSVMNEQNGRYLILRKNHYLAFIQSLPHSFFLQQVNSFIQQSFLRDQSSIYSSNKTSIQLYSIVSNTISLEPVWNSKYSIIEEVIVLTRKQFSMNSVNNNQYFNTREMIINQHLARKLTKELYFKKSIDFIDYFISKSTLDQRQKTAKNIVSMYGNLTKKQSYMKQSLKILLEYQFSIKTGIKNITTIFNNLMLVSDIGQNQLYVYAKQIIRYTNTTFQDSLLVILRLFSSLFWLDQRLIINFNFEDIKFKFIQHFTEALNKLSDSYQENLKQISIVRSILTIARSNIETENQMKQILTQCRFHLQTAPQLLFKWPLLKSQVMVYYYNLILYLQSGLASQNEQIFWCVQGIDQEIGALRQREKIGYYHISILHFFIKTKNIKGMHAVAQKLQNCILDRKILINFKIYFNYLYEAFQVKQHKSVYTYKNILDELKQDPEDSNKLVLFRVLPLFQFNKEQYQKLDDAIYLTYLQILEKLRQMFPLYCLHKFSSFFQKYQRYLKSPSQWGYLFTILMSSIHQYSQNLQQALQSCIPQFQKIFPIDNNQRFDYLIKNYLLQRSQKHKQLVEINRKIAKSCNIRSVTFVFMISVVKHSLSLGKRETEVAVSELYEWVKKYNAWEEVFNLPINSFNVVNLFLLMNCKMQQFLSAHCEFLSILRSYPSKQYISNYYMSLLTIFQKYPSFIPLVLSASGILKNKVQIDLTNPYKSIFYAVLLIDNRIQDSLRNSILSFIYHSIVNVSTKSKIILRTHIYHCWVHCKIKNTKNGRDYSLNNILYGKGFRKNNFICKQYLKHPIRKVAFQLFEDYFLNKSKIKNRQNKYLSQSLRKMWMIMQSRQSSQAVINTNKND